MNKIIELTTRFGCRIAFETTGIVVQAIGCEENSPVMVNGMDVVERYNEILYKLQQSY